MRQYELVVIVRPAADEETLTNAIERIQTLVTSRGGEVTSVDTWGRRKLAYPIDRTFEGDYVLAKLSMEGSVTRDLEAALAISEDVLRHLLVRLDN